MSVVKEMFSRKRILPLLLMLGLVFYWYYQKPKPLMVLDGVTFGSIAYHVKYKDEDQRNFKESIDSLLVVFNTSLSHYIPDSELSRFNKSSEPQEYSSPFFHPVLEESRRIYDLSDGAFNPAIMSLVNAWGFGPDKEMEPDSILIDSLLKFSDFNLVEFDYAHVGKKDARVQLDFSASAKGYGVDVIAHFLAARGVEDYFVEIGGELICRGVNAQNNPWQIGIIKPESDLLNQSYIATVGVKERAMATSANNFNYRVVNGVKYSHTLDPKTGYPVSHSILSATIFAKECMTADALATACMVMGIEKASAMIDKLPDVDAVLIYSGDEGELQTYVTKGIEPMIKFVEK